MLATALVAAILLLVNVRFKGWRLPAAGIAVMVVVFIAAAVTYPAIVQAYVVQPKELAREERFIKYNIEFTQDAFNMQNDGETPSIVTTEYPADDSLTAGELAANQATIDNIRIWDPRLLLQVLQQRQVLRQEYTFDDASWSSTSSARTRSPGRTSTSPTRTATEWSWCRPPSRLRREIRVLPSRTYRPFPRPVWA